ncbi:putative immunity protein [Capnocytophaga cynodegmi]|uniref:putative immunity protein n=1 Tax=Capnocytophaga cynodegmi TaxID=28189 RepID=UPI00385F3646
MDFYKYQKPVGKIEDISALRDEFITIFDTKNRQEIVLFCLSLAQHIINFTKFEPCDEMLLAFEAMKEWLEGKTNYHKARNISFEIGRLAKGEGNEAKVKFYRTMAQIAASPHTKFHGLWATDFAITLINKMFPNNMEAVRKEREKHITLLKASCFSNDKAFKS